MSSLLLPAERQERPNTALSASQGVKPFLRATHSKHQMLRIYWFVGGDSAGAGYSVDGMKADALILKEVGGGNGARLVVAIGPDYPVQRGCAVLEPIGHHNLASPSRVREGRPRSGRGGSSGTRHGFHDQQRGSPLRAFGPTLPEGE